MKLFIVAFLVGISLLGMAQNKGKIYGHWGYNRAHYTNSDITFKGNDYNFTVEQAKAKDRQSPWDPALYFNPVDLTIPQYNLRFGYYITDNVSISFGTDHMKYVMVQDQYTPINGSISNSLSPKYQGTYDHQTIDIKSDFLSFEHTDGLNYVHPEIDYAISFLNLQDGRFMIEGITGAGIGVLYPKTNTHLMTRERYDHFHIAGYGLSARVGAKITFFKHFYFQLDSKMGYINMPNIRTTKNKSDQASQKFAFLQYYGVGGYQFTLKAKKDHPKQVIK